MDAPPTTAPHLHAALRARVLAALRALLPELPDAVFARVELTPAREASHGDLATNAALIAAKPAGRKPPELGRALAAALAEVPEIESAEVAGPGFVNLRLQPSALQAQLPLILRAGESWGESGIGGGLAVNVEYVSCNPTGPMHVGHTRGAVVGDALARLLARAGFAVTREFYVNDAGAQVVALAWAAYWRYLQALGSDVTEAAVDAAAPGGLQYRGEYLIPVGEALARAHGEALAGPGRTIAPAARWFEAVRAEAVEAMMASIRDDLAALGIEHDVFTSERALLESGAVERAIEQLAAEGLVAEGTLPPPKGKPPEDWEPRPQTLFLASRFGDDSDRPLRKSDGSNTYFANDIAYHADKIARGAELLVDVWGADHGGYVPRMRAAVAALAAGRPGGRVPGFEVVICQIVHILRGGEPVRMSKRAGNFVTLRDLLEEVGPDAIRFTMLTRRPDAQMEFDLEAVVAQTRENPVFYVQYAHARCRSVLRAAEAEGGAGATDPGRLAGVALERLAAPEELALLRRLAAWPAMLEGAALAREPHRIAFFLYDLAGDFHMLWNRGREAASLRFLQADDPTGTAARLALVSATAIVLRAGLAVLGVRPVEEMR